MTTFEMTLSEALQSYGFYAKIRRLSPNTINDYYNTFTKFQRFLEVDPLIRKITKYQVQAFLAQFEHLSEKTVLIITPLYLRSGLGPWTRT